MKKIILSILFIFTFCLFSCSSQSNTNVKPFTSMFFAFDTNCSISLYGVEDENKSMEIMNNMKELIYVYDNTLSKTKVGSDIYDINNRTTDIVYISELTTNLLDVAETFCDMSSGRFDISAGTLIDLWDIKNRKTLPTESEIKEALSPCRNFNYRITKDVRPDEIRCNEIKFFGNSKTDYDLGGLAKGFCCESLKIMLSEYKEVKGCIINLGGNVFVYGENLSKKNKKFSVGIAKPFSDETIDVVEVNDRCVITSGIYQRYFKIDNDDRIYHHILDPTTGYPAETDLYSVTIICENGLLADYLSTACLLLGIDNSIPLIDICIDEFREPNLQVIFVDKDYRVIKY